MHLLKEVLRLLKNTLEKIILKLPCECKISLLDFKKHLLPCTINHLNLTREKSTGSGIETSNSPFLSPLHIDKVDKKSTFFETEHTELINSKVKTKKILQIALLDAYLSFANQKLRKNRNTN